MDCIFCKIVKGEIPAEISYQDDKVMVFSDMNSQAPHHQLIIPKKHIATLNDMTAADTELVGHLLLTAKNVAKELGIAAQGYRVVMNCNKDGGQTVFHIHLHLMGGRPFKWPAG